MLSTGSQLLVGSAAAAFAIVSVISGAPLEAAVCGLTAGAFLGTGLFGGFKAPMGLAVAGGFGSAYYAKGLQIAEAAKTLLIG